MKFIQWKNLRIAPPREMAIEREMTIEEKAIKEKLVAFAYLGVPALSTLLIASLLGSENAMYWAMAALTFGMSTGLWKMHPQSKSADWKKMFFLCGVPPLVVPTSLELGAGFWSFAVAFGMYFGVKFYYQQTQAKVV